MGRGLEPAGILRELVAWYVKPGTELGPKMSNGVIQVVSFLDRVLMSVQSQLRFL
jgi:hypothetical protein